MIRRYRMFSLRQVLTLTISSLVIPLVAVEAASAQTQPSSITFNTPTFSNSSDQATGAASQTSSATGGGGTGSPYFGQYAISTSAGDHVYAPAHIKVGGGLIPAIFTDSYSFTVTNSAQFVVTVVMPPSYCVNATDTGVALTPSWSIAWSMASSSSVAGPGADTYSATGGSGSFSQSWVNGLVGTAPSTGSPAMQASANGSGGANYNQTVPLTPGTLGYGGTYTCTVSVPATTWTLAGSANAGTASDACNSSCSGQLTFTCTYCGVTGTH
jgi:hypothetical protein